MPSWCSTCGATSWPSWRSWSSRCTASTSWSHWSSEFQPSAGSATRHPRRSPRRRLEGGRASPRQVAGPHVLVTGHPFVDVWAGIRPEVMNLAEWPHVPAVVEWKQGMCAALGVSLTEFWPHLRNRVRTFADLRPELVGAVERLIDFVAPAATTPGDRDQHRRRRSQLPRGTVPCSRRRSVPRGALTKPFHPVLNDLPMVIFDVGFGGTVVLATGSALRFSCTRNVASETRSSRARFIAWYCSTKRLPLGELALQAQHVAEVGGRLEELAHPVEAGLGSVEPGVDVDHLARHVFGALRGGAAHADGVELGDRRFDLLRRQLDHERGGRRPVVGDVDRVVRRSARRADRTAPRHRRSPWRCRRPRDRS